MNTVSRKLGSAIARNCRFVHLSQERYRFLSSARISVANARFGKQCNLWKNSAPLLRSTQITPRRFFTTPVQSQAEESYEDYRKTTPSAYILAELQLETLHTERRIDQDLYLKLLQEVHQAWNRQVISFPEQGPTGTWTYDMIVDPITSKRLYQRTWKGDEETRKVILELEPSDEVLSMSLSVDEACIACLVENVETGLREVRLRHNESDRESVLHFPDNGVDQLVGLEWGPIETDGDHLLYLLAADQQGRPYRVLVSSVHPSVLDVTKPNLLLQSDDPAEMMDVQRTKGCQYVAIQTMTKDSNEVYLSSGTDSLFLVQQRQQGVLYHVDVGEWDDIAILMSHDGGEYRLLNYSISSLPLDTTETLNAYMKTDASERTITDMDLFRDYLLLYENNTSTGIPQITIRQHSSVDVSHSVTIPLTTEDQPCVKVTPSGNSSFVSPPELQELDMSASELVRNVELKLPNKMPCYQERVFVESKDGTQVPLSLVYGPSNDANSWTSWFGISESSRPVLLMGYGSYGEPVNLGYDPSLVPLIERGFVLAFAHTRGGGELGRSWYNDGKLNKKVNAIDDFESCAEYLKGRFKGTVSAKGFSAGGLLIGATMNRQPDLFDNVILTNAFLDVYATMTNPTLYLTQHEWDEFGNPILNPETKALIQSYCPMENIPKRTDSFPRCLVIGTLDDINVPHWNATIFAKKVRDRMEKKDRVYLHLEESGGHHLGQKRLQIAALELAFLLQRSKTPEHS
eukprot:Nitzschia sp. Nitz4//scaffold11_size288233//245683//247950//NITZ4_000814-RA/size288233-snap-gene-0.32-mRNA-1//1//CDS//3329534194//842//frame0